MKKEPSAFKRGMAESVADVMVQMMKSGMDENLMFNDISRSCLEVGVMYEVMRRRIVSNPPCADIDINVFLHTVVDTILDELDDNSKGDKND
jgi:hypothetical protein|tara:strand:+ start:2632 stop:2907 length:276 start_codon:yes stop_codon:yes gene_type:complete